jgi:hypothetical protein
MNHHKAKARKGIRKMNAPNFGTKLEKDGTRIKRDFSTLVGDGVTQLKDEYDQFTGNVKDTANETASVIKKSVNSGMKGYNGKVHEVADNVSPEINLSIQKYPWVVISLSVLFGLVLGLIISPSRQLV